MMEAETLYDIWAHVIKSDKSSYAAYLYKPWREFSGFYIDMMAMGFQNGKAIRKVRESDGWKPSNVEFVEYTRLHHDRPEAREWDIWRDDDV